MKELDKIFNIKPAQWKGYDIQWCDLCETYTIVCKKCRKGSCSGGACEQCENDYEEFRKLKPYPEAYLTVEDNEAVERYKRLKRFIKECLQANRPLDFKWLHKKGKLCGNDYILFHLDKEKLSK